MKISIITVAFNSVATIRDTIESVLAQTYADVEYIVIDGASTDGTLDTINEYRDSIAHVVSEPDQGIYDAMNKGIRLATGDVVGILNSDDFYEAPDVIAAVAERFAEAPDADMVSGNLVYVKPDDLQTVVRYYSSKAFRPGKLRYGWMPPHPATFITKSAYERYGLYLADFSTFADYELFVRFLLVHKLKFCHLDKVIVRMRVGGVSTSGLRSVLRQNAGIVRSCRENRVYTNAFFACSRLPFKILELLKKPA